MVYIAIIITIFMCELLIKNYIEKNKTEDTYEPVLGGRIFIRKFFNRGALLNLGNKRRRIVAAVSLLFTVLMIVFFLVTLTMKGNTCLKLGLAFLLGGAFSNTYDRFKRKYVVDYFSFRSRFPRVADIVFNIADFCIAIGAAMAAIAVILDPRF